MRTEMMTQRWISKIEVGNAVALLQVLRANNGEMRSANLQAELGIDKATFKGYLNTLKRLGLIRFSDWFPYEKTFRVRLVEKSIVVAQTA